MSVLLKDCQRLLKEYDFSKNNEDLNKLTVASKKKIFWKCEHEHKWSAIISNRYYHNNGCPYCSGKKYLKGYNDLLSWCKNTSKEYLLDEWDYSKNELLPENIKYNSRIEVSWKCGKGHRWPLKLYFRTKRNIGCPYCNSNKVIPGENDLKTLFPELAKEWDYDLNNKGPENYTQSSSYNAAWKCNKGHKWNARIYSRTNKNVRCNCPYCSGRRIIPGENDLKTLFPELIKEWDFQLNIKGPESYRPFSHQVVNWTCNKGHKWKYPIMKRTGSNTKCPYCIGKRPIEGETDLATLFPEIVKEWDFEKNLNGPETYLPYSSQKVFLRCKNGHSYSKTLSDRIRYIDKNMCKYCAGRAPIKGINDLCTTQPELILEWNYEKNRSSPERYMAGSNSKVWWRCSICSFVWNASINNRTRGKGCPKCAKFQL